MGAAMPAAVAPPAWGAGLGMLTADAAPNRARLGRKRSKSAITDQPIPAWPSRPAAVDRATLLNDPTCIPHLGYGVTPPSR